MTRREVIIGNIVRGIQTAADKSSSSILKEIEKAIGENPNNDYCTDINEMSLVFNNTEERFSGSISVSTTDLTSMIECTVTVYVYYSQNSYGQNLNLELITEDNYKQGIKYHRPVVYTADTDDVGGFSIYMPTNGSSPELFYITCGEAVRRYSMH